MSHLFTRSKLNPILKPRPQNWWESQKLYNPGAIYYQGKYHLFYRAIGSGKNWQSTIGYAVSEDGENFQRFNKPLLVGHDAHEKRGIEDPRITRIKNKFYMTYAAFDGLNPRLRVATSLNLKTWKKSGDALPDWDFRKIDGSLIEFKKLGPPATWPMPTTWSKSGGIFPEKIAGQFWMLFGEGAIWLVHSSDGLKWFGNKTPLLRRRRGKFFDNNYLEMGPPPIKTEKGWLVLYHGINQKYWYQISFLMLDLKNPRKILYRSTEPIFIAEEPYEMSGIVDILPGGLARLEKMTAEELKNCIAEHNKKGTMPRVTFCCGVTVVNGILRLFYGASDSIICTATARLDAILRLAG